MKKIRFFMKDTGETAPANLEFFITADGSVLRNNELTFESQCSVIGLSDCIVNCPGVDWEVQDVQCEKLTF